MTNVFKKVRDFVHHYETHISSAALIGGFILDSLTLRRIDLFIENLVIFCYILIAGAGIVLLNLHETETWKGKAMEKMYPFFPVAIQFAFGGLFSNFLVFYSRSASFITSWPYVVLLLGLLIGNELFKKYYSQLTFQITVFFFVLYSFLIFYIPVLIGKMGDLIFVLSGLISFILISGFLYLLSHISSHRLMYSKKYALLSIAGVLLIVNVFYFTNILPPIPLSLKEAGVYHNVTRTAEGYQVLQEMQKETYFFKSTPTIHVTSNEPVYVYSSVFAPTALTTNIVHHWEYYNEQQKDWVTVSRINFPIAGGRDGGYRGYSFKSNTFTGLWRVNVETVRGQLIGRVRFYVEKVDEKVPVETIIRN